MFQDVEVESEVATKQPPGDYRSKWESPVRVLWDQLRLGNQIWVFKLLRIKPNQILSFRLMPSSFRQFVIWLLFWSITKHAIHKAATAVMAGFESLIDFLFHTTHGQMGGQTRLRRVGTDPGQTLEHVARGKFCPICGYFCYISMYCVFGNVATNSFFFFFGGGGCIH